jgi:C_GCAxxG_C_C family probable redox protein
MTKCETALDLLARRFNCAQAILGAYGPAEGLGMDDCLRVAAPFGGGIGQLGETCGAVSGALMVLGLRYGGEAATNPQAKAALYERVREFVLRFKARNQSIVCRDLLGCDISTPEGWQQVQARQTHQTVCPKFIRDAAEFLDEM